MNRRSFLSALLKAGTAFTILPPATTYQRIWRVVRPPLESFSCQIQCSNIPPFWRPIDVLTDRYTAKRMEKMIQRYYQDAYLKLNGPLL